MSCFDLKGAQAVNSPLSQQCPGAPPSQLHYLLPFSYGQDVQAGIWLQLYASKRGDRGRGICYQGLCCPSAENKSWPSTSGLSVWCCQELSMQKLLYLCFSNSPFLEQLGSLSTSLVRSFLPFLCLSQLLESALPSTFTGEALQKSVKQCCGWRNVCPASRVIVKSYPSGFH